MRNLLGHYDRRGQVIDFEAWARLCEELDYRIVAQELLPNGRWVSTVWLGLDHRFVGDGPPLIFESMVFPRLTSLQGLDQRRYSSETAALAGHQELVRLWRLRPNRRVKKRVLAKWQHEGPAREGRRLDKLATTIARMKRARGGESRRRARLAR